MERRAFIAGGIAAVVAPTTGRSQSAAAVRRVGFVGLAPLSDPDTFAIFDAFRQSLREQGFAEGRNLEIMTRTSDGVETRFPGFVDEMLSARMEVIVTVGSAATLAAKRATATVPIVMAAVPNPEGLGLVVSLARPGGNVTGFSTVLGDIAGKLLEVAKESMPQRVRIGFMSNSDNPGSARAIKSWPMLARQMKLEPITVNVRNAAELEPALARLLQERPEIFFPHPTMWVYRERILAFAARHRIPVIFNFREWARDGALLSLGPDLRDNHRQVALYVARILNGANPGDLPVQQPTKLELVINLKTAKELGIEIPQSVLARADEVIE